MAKQIQNAAGEVQSEASILAKYFRGPEEKLQDFMAQLKELGSEGKTELAHGAAIELGLSVVEVP